MPLTRRQIYRRRRVAVFGGLGVTVSLLLYVPLALLAPLEPATVRVQPLAAPQAQAAAPDWPDYGSAAVGAIGHDEVYAEHGPTEPTPIASISKLVTVLVSLQQLPLGPGEQGPSVTLSADDAARYLDYQRRGGKVIAARAGLTFTQYELLQIVLLESANNYADTLAAWAYGSVEAYVAAAGEWLAAQGLAQTTIVDATGLSPENRSTPADLLTLAELAHADPLVREITGTAATTIHDVGLIENTNTLVGSGRLSGLKTGTLPPYGRNLLFTAERTVGEETVTVTGVVLGAPDEQTLMRDALALAESTAAGFQQLTLTEAGAVYAALSAEWGARADAVAATRETMLVYSDVPVTVLVSTRPLTAGDPGQQAGTVTFTVGERTVTVPLVLDEALAEPDMWWRLANPF